MFYGVIIAFGAFLYLIWKFLFAKDFQPTLKPAGPSALQNESSIEHNKDIIDHKTGNQKIQNEESYQSVEIKSLERKNENFSNAAVSQDLKSDVVKNAHKHVTTNIAKNVEDIDLITPSVLLKQRNQHNHDKLFKRQSPPKERFAEFLEKTVLNDDKLQSIIHNLSLDECSLTKSNDNAEIAVSRKESLLSENAIRLQESIDEIGDRFKSINAIITETETKNKTEVNKDVIKPLLLKRLEKQTGVPAGLNFGSVIGELKIKTKSASNGNLKPVFKKFDIDTVDNNQARLLYNFITRVHTFPFTLSYTIFRLRM